MPGYSDVLMDHFLAPRNVGCMDVPDAWAMSGKPGRTAFMGMYFRLEGDVVADAKFQTFGCGPAIAAGSLLTELTIGRKIEECLALTEQELDKSLGGLPPEKAWCAGLAITTMRKALGRELIDKRSAVVQSDARVNHE